MQSLLLYERVIERAGRAIRIYYDLFEKAFGCEVEVDLLKSIKVGDEICLMKIVPKKLIWE